MSEWVSRMSRDVGRGMGHDEHIETRESQKRSRVESPKRAKRAQAPN